MNRKTLLRSSSKLMIASLAIIQVLSGLLPLFTLSAHAEDLTSDNTPVITEPVATTVPDPTVEPTVTPEPTVVPSVEPSVVPEPTTIPEPPIVPIDPNEQLCYSSETVRNTNDSEWTVNSITGTAETKGNVELGVTYVFPLDTKVSVKFNCLPKDESLRTSLKIEQIYVSELSLPVGTYALGEYAYDITTGMVNETFKYDVTLPKPVGEIAEISYMENLGDALVKIDNSKITQEYDSAKASNIDHFTILIVTTTVKLSGTVNGLSQVTVVPNGLITISVTSTISGDDWLSTRYEFGNLGTICINTPDHTVDGTYTEEFTVNAPSSLGTYDLNIRTYEGASCSGTHSNTLTLSNAVIVSNPMIVNPTLSQACGLDIALVLDVSGSISSSELLQMQTAFKGFVDALDGTPTQFSVTEFDTTANVLQSFTSDLTLVKSKIDSAGGGNYTNWQDGLTKSWITFGGRADKPNLMIFSSDGNPNRTGTSGTSVTEPVAVADAVVVANTIKTAGTRILALGIGSDLDSNNMKAISGPLMDTGDVLTSDVISSDFSTLAAQLSTFAKQTCGGKISVNKYVDGVQKGDEQTWSFKIDGTTTITTDGNGQVVSGTLSVGNHSISEVSLPNGYSYDHATCTNGTNDPTNKGIKDISVTADSIIVCNFYNTTNKGSIKLIKNTVGANGTFSFTTTGGLIPSSPSITTLSNTGYVEYVNLMPGTYSIAETVPSNWNLESAVCSDQSPVSAISLQAGENITCTFTNTLKTGKLIVQKATLPAGNTTSFTINATGNGTITGGGAGTVSTTSDMTYEVTPGTYSVSESDKAGWTETSNTCKSIIVGAGETKTCTITNGKLPTLKVTKTVTNDNGGKKTADMFALKIGSAYVTSGTANYLPVGKYVVSEDADLNYIGTIGKDCDTAGNIILDYGDDKECTIINDDKAPSLILNKIVGINNEGTAVKTEWTLTATGPSTISGAGGVISDSTFKAGVYELSESTGPKGYIASAWDCKGSSMIDGTHVVVNLGDAVTCTITNSDEPAHLTLVKTISSNWGGPTDPTLWTLSASRGTNIISGKTGESNITNAHVSKGTYILSETGPSGYTAGAWNCIGVKNTGDSITLNNGESATCMINNDAQPGKLIVNKVIIKNDGGTAKPEDFSFSVNGAAAVSFETDGGNEFNVSAGTYSVVESNPGVGYIPSYDKCSDIVIANGETKTCTITNDDQPGKLIVKKVLIINAGGAEKPEYFNFKINGGLTVGFESDGQNDISKPAGTYSVVENNPGSGFKVTYDNCSGLVLTNGGTQTCTITNTKYATINAIKFDDKNGDGDFDGGEPNLANWGMTLYQGYDCSGTVLSTSQTGSSGQAKVFGQLLPGQYSVLEQSKPADWVSTAANQSLCKNIELGAGDSTDLKFGNFKLVDITGKKYEDKDKSGHQDSGENGISNWKITLEKWNGSTYVYFAQTTTDSSGNYKFENLGPGKYKILEDKTVDGWTPVYPASGEYTNITLTSGETGSNVTNRNFGNVSHVELILEKKTDPSKFDKDFEVTVKMGRTTIATEDINAHKVPVKLDIQQGTYSLSEATVAGWEKDGVKCSYVKEDNDRSSGSNGLDPENLTAKPGDHIICTFSNNKLAELTLVKVTNPSKFDKDFEVKITKSEDGHEGYSSNGISTLGGHDDGITKDINASEHPVEVLLTEGKYNLTESLPDGWISGGVKCKTNGDDEDKKDNEYGPTSLLLNDNNNDNNDEDQKDREVTKSINLEYGDEVTCTFTNNKLAELTLIKKTVPEKIDQDFKVEIDKVKDEGHEDEDKNFSVQGHEEDKGLSATINATDHKPTVVLLDQANWSLTEELPHGWMLEGIVCKKTKSEEDDKNKNEYSEQSIGLAGHDEDEDKDKLDPDNLKIEYGMNITCTFTNNKLATLKVINFNDVNGNGDRNIPGVDQPMVNKLFDLTSSVVDMSKKTDSHGYITFPNLLQGDDYILSNTLDLGWRYTNIHCDTEDSLYTISNVGGIYSSENDLKIKWGDEIKCYYGQQIPLLLINKTNDATTDKAPGDSVGFTITLEIPSTIPSNCEQELLNLSVLGRKDEDKDKDNCCIEYAPADLEDIKVSDVLPAGFDYNDDGVASVALLPGSPVYGLIGEWLLANPMHAGDIVTLDYTATIAGDVDNGLYTDLAWAEAKAKILTEVEEEGFLKVASTFKPLAIESDTIYAIQMYDNPTLPINFVDTAINVFKPLAIPDQAVILGTSTIRLPRTGLDDFGPIVIALSLFGIGAGTSLAGILWEKRKKLLKLFSGRNAIRLATFIGLFFGVSLMLGFTGVEKVFAATSMVVKIEQPESPTNKSSFDITYVAGSLDPTTPIAVSCQVQKPGEVSFSQFYFYPASSNTGACNLSSSNTTLDGVYSFKAIVNGTVESNVVLVTIDRISPATPVEYNRVKVNSCTNTINFKTANDGRTAGVDVFRSELTTFTATKDLRLPDGILPPGSLLTYSVTVGPNTNGTLSDTVPDCSKTYFYVIQAVDVLGNRSGFIGDKDVHVIYYTPVPSPTPTTTGGTTIVDENGNIITVTPTVKPDGTTIDTNTNDGLIAGATDNEDQKTTNNNLLIIFIVIGAVILAGFVFEIRLKKPTA